MSVVCAPFYVMVSEVSVYRSHIVDLNFSRSIHCCHKCNLTGFNNCPSEIHVGHCTPAAHIGSISESNSASSTNDAIGSRTFPYNLPHPLPLSTTSSKPTRTVHHYKFESASPNDSQDLQTGSSTSTASATIIPQRKSVQIINKEPSLVNGNEGKTSILVADPRHLVKPNVRGQIQTNSTKTTDIPRFYYPRGKPKSNEEVFDLIQIISEKLKLIESISTNSDNFQTIPKSKMDEVTKILNVPLYWKQIIYMHAGGDETNQCITADHLLTMWQRIIKNNHNEASQFFALITQEKKLFIEPQDFYPLVQDVLETHPGLTFLLSARDFHSRYIATVVYRIFFGINSTWSMKVTLQELVKSDLLPIIRSLENTDDINTITQYFSYEHFYVIYCKFWELDEDHDLVISKADLARHNNYAISERMIERIFSGSVTKSRARTEGLMTYTEFVWFLLAEEDKRHPRSIEYWFRCMDIDGDGILSLYELDYFYQEQIFRMEEMGIEPISFEDCICQMLDMIKPKIPNKIRLSDLKRCRLVSIFFDTFFNLTKYLEHEQKDPFTNLKDLEDGLGDLSDWDRYAADAYEILVAEDGGSQDNYIESHRESGQVKKKSNESRDEEAVYENISLKQGGGVKTGEKIYDSPSYTDFVNGKLNDITEHPSEVSQPLVGQN